MAGGGRESRSDFDSILAQRSIACIAAFDHGHDYLALRQRVRSLRHCLCPNRWTIQPRHAPDWAADLRRCFAQPGARLCGGNGNGVHHGLFDSLIFSATAPFRKVVAMTISAASTNVVSKEKTSKEQV